jgi:opacity protein-like surface antigen
VLIVRIIRIASVCVAMAAACAAADPKPPTPESAGWWTKSSLSDRPMPTKILYHFQGTLSYMNAEGNTEGSTFDTKGELQLRRWRFTDQILGEYSRRDVTYGGGGGTIDTTESTVRNHLGFDLTKRLSLVAGVENYKNTLMFMDKRFTVYGGAGAELVQREKHQVYLIVGLGHANFVFDHEAMLRINPTAVANLQTTSPDSGATLLMQNWTWKMTPIVTLHENGTYMDFAHGDLGNQWSLGYDVNVALARRFSLAVGYHAHHEDNA